MTSTPFLTFAPYYDAIKKTAEAHAPKAVDRLSAGG